MENNKEQIEVGSMEGIVTVGPATSEETSTVAESQESVTSTGGVDDTSVTVSMEKEPWPEGGVDSFTNHALPSLVFGMLGIFLVLGLIAVATVSLNKLFPGKKD